MVTADDVLEVVKSLQSAGVAFWLDGGWGVDALLGQQTRDHTDVDVVIASDSLEVAVGALNALGYGHDEEARPGMPARFAMVDGRGREVDLHLVVIDSDGNGWQSLGEEAWGMYPADGLAGRGVVGGREVPCVTPELQLRHHLGYPWSWTDRHDMALLAERFGLALPPHRYA